MLQLIRTNPGVLISLGLIGGCVFVCLLVGFVMARNGASLRPLFWFFGFFMLVVAPQFIGHFWKALDAMKQEAPRVAALEQLATNSDTATRAAAVKLLFGPDADAQLVTDARKVFGDAFEQAELAQFAALPNGDSVLLARFTGYTAAEKGWFFYLRNTGLNQLSGKGDSQRGYAVTRPAGDRAYALHMDRMVGIWTGKDDAAIRDRMTTGGFKIPRRAPLAGTETAQSSTKASATTEKTDSFKVAFATGALAVYLFLVVLYFFKGSAWAGTYRAKSSPPVTVTELAARLEAINSLDVPFRIERGPQTNQFFATWRYADAKWIDLARARGMNRTIRIRMILDERNGTVRATDYAASFDWSAGRGGANLEWKSSLGIVFFQSEHQRVFGLQLDEQGRFKPELSYAYTFNLNEMKSPLVEAVTRAGWNWRPTAWQGPTWLRWLTE